MRDFMISFDSGTGPVFTKGLSQGLGLKLKLLSLVSGQKLLRLLRLSGISKEFKTSLRLSQGLIFKTGKWEA